jgi:hypothetical protein
VDQARRLKELEQENAKLKRLVAELSLDELVLKDICLGKLLSPERRPCAVTHALEAHGMSERRARQQSVEHRPECPTYGVGSFFCPAKRPQLNG